MSVYDLILRRRTIRRFRQDPVPFDLLLRMVNAARLAPSGANLQPLEYVVVTDPEIVPRVFAATRWAAYLGEQGVPREGERPPAYVVVLINRQVRAHGGYHDCGAAIENMILVALEAGFGTCWIGSLDKPALHQTLGIPEAYEIDSVLAVGAPAEVAVPEPMGDSVRYYRDGEGVHHVPKRNLREVLHLDRYGSRYNGPQP
ncbi:MAG: nitroreductase family protein [candidate division KSB1 bacterium]|nr:nitroreductase family protein [candidate division KSB1 bacterium]